MLWRYYACLASVVDRTLQHGYPHQAKLERDCILAKVLTYSMQHNITPVQLVATTTRRR
jgi:hypothetical protein